ncbi:hypothetical protein GTH52_15275 (plasmid) [Clostridium tyrobutyricum]|uniref:DUF3828 domain-containing protein n=1 Tax=Clostridium tyrobutyricum DIVETGP TaxID=1408889 RepID=W6N403_CLOTY|nr:DUF3828 domain-containing protein [Clostridium tyrobutyricum]AND86341.1 hypothetical protein CTK_P00430 [Clostridium tyrobutyricum]ANP70919.1 hypothetical protein BA182_14570 [Clostridium tyrobutyricum]MBV4432472.1 hypothetical protein [Clostridium tyrobutyricum]MBV4435675.1 hypothetical protein [Clostridium tyrobutyricum]QNB68242.1 hypothetical protein GTH52_15275 [Clostridium tyrobutyricum]
MKVKSKFICMGLILTLIIAFTGCGFNEDKAKTDSKQQLESFLKLYKNQQVIVKATDTGDMNKEKVKEFVNKKFKDYFTNDFINDTNNQIETGSLTNGKTFYIFEDSPIANVLFTNKYSIDSPKVNKDNKTVEYKLKGNDGFAEYAVDVIMKQEDGKWKIDKAN